MRTRILITLLLLTSLNCLYGQVNLNESITDFHSNCSEPTIPEDTVAEFALLELTTKAGSTTLNFEIVANCAQKKMGALLVSGDTLTIDKTDVTITNSTRYEKVDSTGNTLEITEETHVADIAFCDCLVNFYYELSTSLDNINFLTFHERTFELNGMKKNAR